jgi:DNA transformation protein
MPYSDGYLQYVLEQLAGLRGAVSRPMFGGAGLYHEDLFFGLIASDTLYLRVNDDNRGDYEALGMSRFKPYKDRSHLSFNYYEVPAHVLEDAEELLVWARRSLNVAEIASQEAKLRKASKAARASKASRASKAPKASKASSAPKPSKPSKASRLSLSRLSKRSNPRHSAKSPKGSKPSKRPNLQPRHPPGKQTRRTRKAP